MIRQIIHHRGTRVVAGLTTGLCISGLVACAVLQACGYFDAARSRWLEKRLHAAAAQGGSTLAVATGMIEQGIEGIFVLDFITGDLTGGVLNPRTGQIGGLFRRNIAADLGVEQGKQPKYLMLTGHFDAKGMVSNTRPAMSIVYVADENTGRYMGYMLPWNPQLINQNRPQLQALVPIGGGSARNAIIE
jgi:hypothetical protein